MAAYPRPLWRLTLASADLNTRLAPRLMQLSLTDNRGMEADQLDITLSDADGLLDLPKRGVEVHLWLGWSDTGLVDKGTYTVDEVEHSGAPDQLTIRARSADLREGLSNKKERSWHQTTVGAIVQTIAEENGLEAAVSPELAGEVIEHLDQTDESDASFLTRLAERYDAIANIKSGKLLFFKIGRGKTLSGETLETVKITRQSGDRHRFTVADRDGANAVKATWYDRQSGKKGEVIVRVEPEKGQEKVSESATENIKTLRHCYASQGNAQCGAKAALAKLERAVSTFALSLARGRPDIFPDLPAHVSGWKPAIDGTDWWIAKVSHKLSDAGLTTDIDLELKIDDDGNDDDGNDGEP
ncbi:MAG: phage late control D family protein [Candidatus Accumulibacter sp.]|jgi:phage protein D|nr:phage late control D family protein [Accumulibacter sp.]